MNKILLVFVFTLCSYLLPAQVIYSIAEIPDSIIYEQNVVIKDQKIFMITSSVKEYSGGGFFLRSEEFGIPKRILTCTPAYKNINGKCVEGYEVGGTYFFDGDYFYDDLGPRDIDNYFEWSINMYPSWY